MLLWSFAHTIALTELTADPLWKSELSVAVNPHLLVRIAATGSPLREIAAAHTAQLTTMFGA
eukprot:SAG31_NODE_1715_length_7461_cov_2.903695_4_plen_62_part_00